MGLLKNSDWYDIARQTNWTPSYVKEEELFPREFSDPYDIPVSEWEKFDEPFR
jgi:toluene monooxygenase system protein A